MDKTSDPATGSVMGLVSLGLAGLLGLGIKRKEEKDNP